MPSRTMKKGFGSSLRPVSYWMKLVGIQMNVSGKDPFTSEWLVGMIGLAIFCRNVYPWGRPLYKDGATCVVPGFEGNRLYKQYIHYICVFTCF